MEKFISIEGYVEVNNHQLSIKKKGNIYTKGSWIGIVITAILIKIFKRSKLSEQGETIKEYIGYGIFGIVGLFFLLLGVYFIFFYHWKNNIEINTISKIEIENDKELESEIMIFTNKGRQKSITFRTLENQVEPFLSELKKRNSRILIKEL